MTNVLYVPLDERACNYYFPQKLAAMTKDMQLLLPAYEDMGYLKTPARTDKIWDWLFANARSCDYAILSVDTLVYGNIINSRTHHRTASECRDTLEQFRKLKELNPNLKIHAFNLAARVAAYDDAHEDPDYWATHGRDIWRYTYLLDKISRTEAPDGEKEELEALKASIPEEYLSDFMKRREVDRFTNLYCVDLVKDGVFDILTIPKDDTAEYGYAAMDQAAIARKVHGERLMGRVLVYPGADEVGSVLFTRVFNLVHNYTPRVYVRYSSTLGPTIIPRYEDRPLHESIKSQITSIGGICEDNSANSDCMLAVNSPGKYMIEASEQHNKDLTFTSHINMYEFLRYIKYYIKQYKKSVGVAEVSVSNGCEREFMEFALSEQILHLIQGAGGWNTSQNTIGVVLAQTVISSYYDCYFRDYELFKAAEEFKLRNIICDWLYQSVVLQRCRADYKDGVDPYSLGVYYDEVRDYFVREIEKEIQLKFGGMYKGAGIELVNLYFNWDGIFYINFDIKLNGIKHIL